MKRKYYMRGLGIGIIVTAILFTIVFPKKETVITDEEVIARAQKLGYTKQTSGITPEDINKIKENETKTTPETDGAETTPVPTQEGTPEPSVSPEPTPEPPEPPVSPEATTPTMKAPEKTPSPSPTATSIPVTKPVKSEYKIKVEKGMSASDVARKLESMGAIEDADALIAYIIKENMADYINIGTFTVLKDSTFKEIVDILTK